MNLRIQELLKQARVTDNWNKADWYSMSPEMIEKFAQLIVKECAEVADKAEPYQTSDLILKHFGVEL
jgi:hypothetical protein